MVEDDGSTTNRAVKTKCELRRKTQILVSGWLLTIIVVVILALTSPPGGVALSLLQQGALPALS